MIRKKFTTLKDIRNLSEAGSLTVEAALVLPLFLYFMIAFLYFIQIFTLQETIQSTITQMGLDLAKTAYVYEDFGGIEDALNLDETLFGTEIEIGLGDFAKAIVDRTIIKMYAKNYLDTDRINKSCIKQGFDGISFSDSSILKEDEFIDIVVRYHIEIPIKLFNLEDMSMIQRVRVRGWTGYDVSATYTMEEEEDGVETMVYITETGTVYHKKSTCSHIKLSVSSIQGVPTSQRNESGAKYYPCESCCKGEIDKEGIFYITSDGTRYHSIRGCSRIKRNVKEIPLSEIGNRAPCKRCA